jgi:hypothetical protein
MPPTFSPQPHRRTRCRWWLTTVKLWSKWRWRWCLSRLRGRCPCRCDHGSDEVAVAMAHVVQWSEHDAVDKWSAKCDCLSTHTFPSVFLWHVRNWNVKLTTRLCWCALCYPCIRHGHRRHHLKRHCDETLYFTAGCRLWAVCCAVAV